MRFLWGWQVWAVPAPARRFLLLTEAAAVLVAVALVTDAGVPALPVVIRLVILWSVSVSYSELAAHSTRVQRYLGSDRAFSNAMSVWSFAAVLLAPLGWAMVFIAAQYGHAMWQRRRDATGHPYRVVFTAAAVMWAQFAAGVVISWGSGHAGPLHSMAGECATLAAIVAFLIVNTVLVLGGMWLTARPANIRAMFAGSDVLGYEVGTLLLGIAAAATVLYAPILLPGVLVLVILLHRSSIARTLQHTARTDSKTGLLTITAWTQAARARIDKAERGRASIAVMLLDLDRFKRINDTRGHLAGDRVLADVAACLGEELRDRDCVGRFGGEELVVILDSVTPAEAYRVADRLRAAISDLRVEHASGPSMRITASIGLVHTPTARAQDLDALLHRADVALYQAKNLGRNQVRTAEPVGAA